MFKYVYAGCTVPIREPRFFKKILININIKLLTFLKYAAGLIFEGVKQKTYWSAPLGLFSAGHINRAVCETFFERIKPKIQYHDTKRRRNA